MSADIHRPEEFQRGYERILRESGGGSDDGGMPPDILAAKLEALEKRVDADTREMKADIKSLIGTANEIAGKVSQLPTTWAMASWFVGVATGLAVLVFTVARMAK